jgi:hypothetical protein
MNKIQQQHYLNKESLADNELDFFFEVVFKRLGQELNLLRESIFDNYFCHPTVYEDVFGLNEQAWVGVLNNAIIRAFSDTSNTLLEFTLYNKTEFHGRADLLVQWKNSKGKKINLLYEAKQYKESDESKMKEESDVYLENVKNQALGYVRADKEYFDSRVNLFIVPIIFAWIPEHNLLKIADDYLKSKSEKHEHFCSLYSECNSGAWVYGSVYNSKGEKLK